MLDHVTVEPRTRLGIASVMGRKGVDAAAIGAQIGLALPTGPRAIGQGKRTAIGTGPGAWLLVEEEANSDFAVALQEGLVGLASVSDQSSGYCVMRLVGGSARRLLQRGASIDFHPDSFGPGAAAATVIAHIGAIIWQVDDRPAYDIAIFRSYVESFNYWLSETSAAL